MFEMEEVADRLERRFFFGGVAVRTITSWMRRSGTRLGGCKTPSFSPAFLLFFGLICFLLGLDRYPKKNRA